MGLLLTDSEFLPQAKALVESAKGSIYMSTFKAEITTKPKGLKLLQFFNALMLKAKEGIQIRFLINWNDKRHACPKTNLYVMTQLRKANIKIRLLKNNRCCHAKILLVDKKKAIVGSHNLSIRSVTSNFEMSFVISDPGAAAMVADVFESSWFDAQQY